MHCWPAPRHVEAPRSPGTAARSPAEGGPAPPPPPLPPSRRLGPGPGRSARSCSLTRSCTHLVRQTVLRLCKPPRDGTFSKKVAKRA